MINDKKQIKVAHCTRCAKSIEDQLRGHRQLKGNNKKYQKIDDLIKDMQSARSNSSVLVESISKFITSSRREQKNSVAGSIAEAPAAYENLLR
jgi:hypothetical protein